MGDRVATALCVLGPLEVVRDGERARLGSGQQRRVLAVLLVHANEVVSSDRLVDVLWGDEPPPSATHALQALVSRLRGTLGDDRVETRAPGYRLRVGSSEVDALRFEELVRVGLGSADQAEVALRAFDEALGLWRGSPYAEFASEEFAAAEVARLVELRARAIEERSAALLELSRPEEVIGELEVEIAAEPFRERLQALLMLALARAGRPVESLRAYDNFRRFLADEVGVVPSPGLQELNDDIVRQHPDVSWAGAPGKADLPSGTVTFLFTDVEGTTRLWQEHPDAMKTALARHDAILRDAIESHAGYVVKTTGDGFHAAFRAAHDAVDAAIDALRGLGLESWGATGALRVRMGVHTGEVEDRDGDYYGTAVNRAARLMAIAHGGQVLVSDATERLLGDAGGGSFELVDLGEHRLRDLAQASRVFQVAAPGLESEFPPLRSLEQFASNLPVQLTSFVGRDNELLALTKMLGASRLVTLTGVGGVGKTRLALQVAAEVVGEFRDGVWLCEFASVTDPGAIWETLAASLHVPAFPGRSVEESVLEYLAAKRLLLVLDNCEHLVDAVAQQVDTITQRCARVSVLATSREGLALRGERMVAVAPLGVPNSDADDDDILSAEAVRLFGDRASAARSDFALTGGNARSVGVLCRRVDGIPLAVELAAARVRSMAPEDLVARLDQRFKLLTQGSRAALERHQTLRNTIDWSYDLLNPTERQALDRLSVFAGGCDLAAAEAVLAGDDLDVFDVDDVLGQLVDKSLVVADNDDDGGVRYRLLETHPPVRPGTTAGERGHRGGSTPPRGPLRGGYRRRAGPHLRSRDHLAWTVVVARDTDNFRAALDWAVETPSPEHALRLVAPLARARQDRRTRDWLGRDPRARSPAVRVTRSFPWSPPGLRGAQRCASISSGPKTSSPSRNEHKRCSVRRLPSVARGRATLAFYRNDVEDAQRHAKEWVNLAWASGDVYELAHALVLLGAALQFDDKALDAAIATVDEGVRVARAGGIDTALFHGPRDPRVLSPARGLATRARPLRRSDQVGTRIGDRMGSLAGDRETGRGSRPDMATGEQPSERASTPPNRTSNSILRRRIGASTGLVSSLCELGSCEPAAVLFGKADTMAKRKGTAWDLEMLAATDAALLETLGEQHLATLAERGAALEMAEAVAYLRAEADQALRQD